MKKAFSILALTAALSMLMVGCKSSEEGTKTPTTQTQKGQISLSLKANQNLVVTTKAQDETPVNIEEFTVSIYDEKGALNQSWPYADMPESITLEEGNYKVEAYNFKASGAEFNSPAYYASQDVEVIAQTLKNIDLECKIANIKVTVELTDKFKEKVSDATITVHNNEGMGSLVWDTQNLDQAGYFSVPEQSKQLVVVVKGTITEKNTLIDNVSYTISDVEAAQWHKVTIDLQTTGAAGTSLSINSNIEDKDVNIDIPDSDGVIDNNGDEGSWEDPDPDTDKPTNPDQPGALPTIVGSSLNGEPFDIDQTVTLSQAEVTDQTVLDILFASSATEGIQELWLEITSEHSVISGIFTEPVDLCSLSEGDIYDLLSSEDIGIIDPENPIKGKTNHTFSVGGLMSMLTALGSDLTHNFKVTVKDENGEATKTLTLYIAE